MAKARPIIGLDPYAPTGQIARTIVRERLADMYAYAPYIENPEHIQELHDLRITAKRVRYTLEIFADFLPETSKDVVRELAQLQDELGELHDSEVMLALLRQLLQQQQEERAKELPEQELTLLSSTMVQYVLHSASSTALSEKERRGLMEFLQRQERRREQSYASFRRHWEGLEQHHFRAEILQMLEQERTGAGANGEEPPTKRERV